MEMNILRFFVGKTLRSIIRILFGERSVTIKGDFGQPFTFLPAEHPSILFRLRKNYLPSYHKWIRLLNDDDVIFDVGANIGLTTQAFFSITKGKCCIYAFEPMPRNFKFLKINCQEFHSNSIFPINNAVGNYDGEAKFLDNIDSGALSRHIPTTNPEYENIKEWKNYSEVKVEMITLDTFLKENSYISPTFVKIDVEGSGDLVLKGMAKTIINHKPIFTCEFHTREEIDGIKKILKEAGYQGIVIHDDGRIESCDAEDSEGEFIHPNDLRFVSMNLGNVS